MNRSLAGIPVFDRHPARTARRRTGLSAVFARLGCIAAIVGLFASVPQAAALLHPPTAVNQAAR